eukprot:tig00020892_g14929.t1
MSKTDGKVAPPEEPRAPVSDAKSYIDENRRCRDVLWLVLFIAFWIGMWVVAGFAFNKGDPSKLLYPVDGAGSVCGTTFPDHRFLFWPNPTDVLDSFCVGACPEALSFVNLVCPPGNAIGPPSGAGNATSPPLPLPSAPSPPRRSPLRLLPALLGLVNATSTPARPYSLPRPLDHPNPRPVRPRPPPVCSPLRPPPPPATGPSRPRRPYPAHRPPTNATVSPANSTASNATVPPSSSSPSDSSAVSSILNGGRLFGSGDVNACVRRYLSGDASRCSISYPTTNVFGRCLPSPRYSSLLGGTSVQNLMKDGWSQLNSYLADVQAAWPVELVMGLIAPLVLGFVYLLLLKYLAGIMVWVTILLVIGALVGGTLVFFFKAGYIGQNELNTIGYDRITSEPLPSALDPSSDRREVMKALAWTMVGVTAVALLVLMVMGRRIAIAVGVRPLHPPPPPPPHTHTFPPGPGSAPTPHPTPPHPRAGSAPAWEGATPPPPPPPTHPSRLDRLDTRHSLPSAPLSPLTSSAYPPPPQIVKEAADAVRALVWVVFLPVWEFAAIAVFFGARVWDGTGDGRSKSYAAEAAPTLLAAWTVQVAEAFCTTTIAGSVATYYFTRPGPDGSKRQSGLAQRNVVVKYVFVCLKCCLACLERFLKAITRRAYIMIAMHGDSFCGAAQRSFALVLANILRVAAVGVVGDFLMFLGKLAIVISCAPPPSPSPSSSSSSRPLS